MSDIITRRRRLKSFIGTYLSTLRAYNDGDSRTPVSIGYRSVANSLSHYFIGSWGDSTTSESRYTVNRGHTFYDGSQAGTAERMKSTIASSDAPG